MGRVTGEQRWKMWGKTLNSDLGTIKKEIENIGKIRTRKKIGFKNVKKERDLRKIKMVMNMISGWTSKKILKDAGVVNVNREKRW